MYTFEIQFDEPSSCSPTGRPSLCGDTRRTYGELAERVRRVAGLLAECTDPGDRVALWALNSDRYLELFIGIPCAGRVIVPHNTRWAEPELVDATGDAGARVLICDRDPGGLADVVERVIRLDTGEYDELLAAAPELEPVVTPDTLAGLFYTGGTTGSSKGVMLTHANLMANAVHTQLGQPLVADDRYLTMAPMFHAAGVYAALDLPWVGATNVIVPAFDPDAVLDLIVERRDHVRHRRADDAGGARRAPERRATRRLQPALALARRVARRPRGAPPRRRGVRVRADPPLRGDRAVAAGHRLPPRGAVARRAAGEELRSAGAWCRPAHRRQRRAAGRHRRGRRGRWSRVRT